MKKPEVILGNWIDAVNNGDKETLLSLYDEQAVLIPTFSNRILNNPEKIKIYFESLISRDELCVALHSKTVTSQKISENICSLCGIYCWRFAVDDELLSFEARFSLLLDLSLPAPIIQHHSSQIPRAL